jgi:hypothetical protein
MAARHGKIITRKQVVGPFQVYLSLMRFRKAVN